MSVAAGIFAAVVSGLVWWFATEHRLTIPLAIAIAAVSALPILVLALRVRCTRCGDTCWGPWKLKWVRVLDVQDAQAVYVVERICPACQRGR